MEISTSHTSISLSLTANKNHCQPRRVTASLISPQVGTSVIKSLAEVAFVSPSVVAIATTTAAPEPVTTATVSPEIPASSTSEPSSSVTAVTATEASVATITHLLLLQLWELCGYSQLPTATVCPTLLNLLDFVNWDIKANSCFAFEEGHSMNVALNLFAQLFFEGSPGVTQIMHFLRTHQLQSGVTSIRVEQ